MSSTLHEKLNFDGLGTWFILRMVVLFVLITLISSYVFAQPSAQILKPLASLSKESAQCVECHKKRNY